MTQGPEDQPEQPDQHEQPGQPQQPPPPYGQHPQQPPPQYPPQPPPSGYGYGYPQPIPGAPYGIHPTTGIPYSDKSKLVAGLLQVLLPLGIGRFYIGDTGIGIAQLLVTIFTCGIGALWPFIDGIIMLVTDSKDAQGRILRT
jgi:TM2 domain-containing membrane protein YozV